jgi:hypothetical protein
MLTEACTCASFKNNTTVNEGVDSGKGGSKQFITWGAQAHLIESNMHPAAKASQSKSASLAHWIGPAWSKAIVMENRGWRREEEGHTHRRSGAYLGGMAGQCPRGQQDATRGRLHRSIAGSTNGASTGVLTHTEDLS